MPPAPPSTPFAGRTLGRCVIGKPIGRGATATVFRANYLPLQREVAVKILKQDMAQSAEARERFIEEAKALAKLDHENVVRVFDVVEDAGFLLIIMEFVPGRNLRQILERDGPLDPETASLYARQVALALGHAHAQKTLHRDVKPSNLIVDEEGGTLKLVDFGNTEVLGADAGSRKGTAHYVAPEVFQGKRRDEKSDTYSLGATLFHMLTGEPPYEGQTTREILAAHEAGKLRAPSAVIPDGGIPQALDDIVKRSMAPAKGYRFLAREMAAALDALLPEVGGAAERGAHGRGRRRHRGGGGGGGIPAVAWGGGALLLVAGLVLALTGGKGEPPAAPPLERPPEPARPAAEDPGEAPPAASADGGLKARVETRNMREEAGEKAFQEAEAFEAVHPKEPAKVATQWGLVASEYADLASGAKAKVRRDDWNARAESDAQRAARETRAAEERRRREEAVKAVDEHVAAMRYPEALEALRKLEGSTKEEREALERRRRRLELLGGFKEVLSGALQGNHVPFEKVRPLTRTRESVVEADDHGVKLEGPAAARMMDWTDLRPEEVLALARQVLRSAPEPRIALATFCWEAGLKEEAAKELDTARLTDRTGTATSRIAELFEK